MKTRIRLVETTEGTFGVQRKIGFIWKYVCSHNYAASDVFYIRTHAIKDTKAEATSIYNSVYDTISKSKLKAPKVAKLIAEERI